MISTYGLALVISAFVIYWAHTFATDFREERKERNGRQKHNAEIDLRIQVNNLVSGILDRTILRTHSDRAYVFEFHDGDTKTNLSGLPFLKMSCTYESIGPYAKTEIHRRQGMPFQMYQSFITAIYSKDYLVLDVDHRTAEYAPLIYETLNERDIGITLRTKITDTSLKVIGYLGIDFCSGNPVTREAVEKCADMLLATAKEIGALLSVSK